MPTGSIGYERLSERMLFQLVAVVKVLLCKKRRLKSVCAFLNLLQIQYTKF